MSSASSRSKTPAGHPETQISLRRSRIALKNPGFQEVLVLSDTKLEHQHSHPHINTSTDSQKKTTYSPAIILQLLLFCCLCCCGVLLQQLAYLANIEVCSWECARFQSSYIAARSFLLQTMVASYAYITLSQQVEICLSLQETANPRCVYYSCLHV